MNTQTIYKCQLCQKEFQTGTGYAKRRAYRPGEMVLVCPDHAKNVIQIVRNESNLLEEAGDEKAAKKYFNAHAK